tara:strand:- start:463 stop:795 length:333 start_codon:yes stop_codon:yes gene_type:complete
MGFRQIKSGALANKAVDSTKLDTTAISELISEQLIISTVADNDTVLVFDADIGGLKKVSTLGLIESFTTENLAEAPNSLYFTDVRVTDILELVLGNFDLDLLLLYTNAKV